MQLVLRRTLEEIAEQNEHAIDEPGLLQILNMVSPRDWRFAFTFDSENTITLSINSTPALNQDELLTILDGSCCDMLNAERVIFSSPNESTFAIRITSARTNVLEAETIDAQNVSGIRLYGFRKNRLPPEYSNAEYVEHCIRARTWFGSALLGRVYSKKTFEWAVYGKINRFTPSPWTKMLDKNEPYFIRRSVILLEGDDASVILGVFRSKELKISIRHTRYSAQLPSFDPSAALARALKGFGIYVEINEASLTPNADGRLGPTQRLSSVTQAIREHVAGVVRGDDFRAFCTEIQKESIEGAAVQLRSRQEALDKRSKLSFKGRPLGFVPRSENEVIVLLSKLEVLGALPLAQFTLVEYTPKLGIDALADIQLTPSGMFYKHVPIEVEYHFESFIRHQHPIQQVAMIVCWDFLTAQTPDRRGLSSLSDGQYVYKEKDGTCDVLVISELPGIEIAS